MCPLCEAKNKIWEDGSFYGLICKTCNVPLLVLTDHRTSLTNEEIEEMEDIRKRRYPEYRFRGIGMRSLPQHYHEHIIK